MTLTDEQADTLHKCHGHEGRFRMPNPHTNLETGEFDDQDFRTCDYCGSIHPADLLHVIRSHPGLRDTARLQPYDLERPLRHFQIRLDMADWKYGWPHKFYVEGIPSPLRGQKTIRSSMYRDGKRILGEPRIEPNDATSHCKFYTTHLVDLSDALFVEISREIWRRSDLCFIRKSPTDPLMGWRRTKFREGMPDTWYLHAESHELKSV